MSVFRWFVRKDGSRAGAEAPSSREVAARVGRVLGKVRQRVKERVDVANAASERGVLAASESVRRIVGHLHQQVDESSAILGGVAAAGQGSLVASIHAQGDLVERYVRAFSAELDEQTRVTSQALAQVAEITKLEDAVRRVSKQTHMVSLNLSIEAARLGAHGLTIGVVATEMGALNAQVEQMMRHIATLATDLQAILPRVAAAAATMKDESLGFAREVASGLERVAAGTEALRASVATSLAASRRRVDEALALSNEVLGALQFQDPTAQELQLIDRDLAEGERLVERLVAEPAADAPEPTLAPLETRVSGLVGERVADLEGRLRGAGEVMLF